MRYEQTDVVEQRMKICRQNDSILSSSFRVRKIVCNRAPCPLCSTHFEPVSWCIVGPAKQVELMIQLNLYSGLVNESSFMTSWLCRVCELFANLRRLMMSVHDGFNSETIDRSKLLSNGERTESALICHVV